jgi:HlyD family secretion protein/adhesin transport system membrane fusion protein
MLNRLLDRLWLRLRGGEEQLRFLSLAVVMEEAVTPQVLRIVIVLVNVAVVSFVVWSAMAEVNETAKGPGFVVPTGYAQVVQHLEGGIIAEIITREGDHVTMGQVLVRLDGHDSKKDLRQATIRQVSLELQAERLHAFISDRKLKLSAPSPAFDVLVEKQQRIFSGMMAARRSEAQVLKTQLKKGKDRLATLSGRREAVSRRVEIARDMRDRTKGLVDRGLSNYFEFLRNDDRLNEALTEDSELLEEIGQAEFEVTEFENRLASLDAKYRDDANQELERIETEIGQNKETIAKLTERIKRLEVRSPVDGIVKGLEINTVGEVIGPGTVMMEIVPVGERLLVEMHIAPQDVGQVREGQVVQMKVSSFDFARYGTIDGVLQSISPTTFEDEAEPAPYYLGRIALRKNHLGDDPRLNRILPGMTVEANIVTGSKTILAYLLKPIHTSLSSALSER